MKIYTKTGDCGVTFMPSEGKVRKSDCCINAQGEIDELNAWIGMLLQVKFPRRVTSFEDAKKVASTSLNHWRILEKIQADLMQIGAQLAPNCDFAVVWYWDHKEKYAKVSLRSFHDNIDCSVVAKRFGGGGHPQASGFEYEGNIEDIFTIRIKV